MKKILIIPISIALILLSACDTVKAPEPVMPIPTASQVEWQKQEIQAFVHYGLNTYTGQEWGYGNVDPALFNPTSLDCEQWVHTFKQAGMKGVIITAKHHDGFCLWQTKQTNYSIASSPWKDGKGDVLAELSQACQKEGLHFSFYLSPWDRHQAFYGTEEYLTYYHNQLEELLTQYGTINEVWLDGANGGDGWYGGADCERKIDRENYYDFPKIHEHVWSKYPDAIIFSDAGPGCRWVGNEKGYAGQTNWSFIKASELCPGTSDIEPLNHGQIDGTDWVPAECDVSIRPGWFWHEEENDSVKTPEQLFDLYCKSVGRNGCLLLNVPANQHGLISETDSLSLIGLRKLLDRTFANNILAEVVPETDNCRGNGFRGSMITDGDYDTYWAPEDNRLTGSITFTLPEEQYLSYLILQEYIPLGQRVKSFHIESLSNGEWSPVQVSEETTTIGYKRILRLGNIKTSSLRIVIDDARGCPCINNVEAY